MEAGADVFRLNFSHGSADAKSALIRRIRDISRRRQRAVAILGDLQGPKIRTGLMKDGALQLTAGREVTITIRDVLGEDDLIPTIYRELPRDVQPGDSILLDDGLMELTVWRSADEDVRCRVVVGGILKDRKGMNLPGVNVSAPALTEKDREDLRFLHSRGSRLCRPFLCAPGRRRSGAQGYSSPAAVAISRSSPKSKNRRRCRISMHSRCSRRDHGGPGRSRGGNEPGEGAADPEEDHPQMQRGGKTGDHGHPDAGEHDRPSTPDPRRNLRCGQCHS